MHVDNTIGDRKSECGGAMAAVAKIIKKDGEEVIVHKCNKCGLIRKNRVAGDDDIDLVENLMIVESLDHL